MAMVHLYFQEYYLTFTMKHQRKFGAMLSIAAFTFLLAPAHCAVTESVPAFITGYALQEAGQEAIKGDLRRPIGQLCTRSLPAFVSKCASCH